MYLLNFVRFQKLSFDALVFEKLPFSAAGMKCCHDRIYFLCINLANFDAYDLSKITVRTEM